MLKMKAKTRILLMTVFCICLNLTLNAQAKKMEFSSTIGFVLNHEELGTDFQEFGYGGHLGFNLYSKKAKRLKTDLQVSLNLSGGEGISSDFFSLNALYGGRYYFTKLEKSTKVFTNILVGGSFVSELGDDFTENRLEFGYSVGLFINPKRFLIGVSAESFNNFIFKIGYIL